MQQSEEFRELMAILKTSFADLESSVCENKLKQFFESAKRRCCLSLMYLAMWLNSRVQDLHFSCQKHASNLILLPNSRYLTPAANSLFSVAETHILQAMRDRFTPGETVNNKVTP